MYFNSLFLFLALVAPSRALAVAVPLDTTAHLQERDDIFTISIKNQYGSPLFVGLGPSVDASGFIGNPQPQTLFDYGEWSVPPKWAGRINVVKDGSSSDFANSSLIEGSYDGQQRVYMDVSYVDGYSVPITCGMNAPRTKLGATSSFLRGDNAKVVVSRAVST